MKKYLLFLLLVISLFGCQEKDQSAEVEMTKTPFIRLKTVHGDIIVRINKQQAPLTSTRVLELAKQGFYNGLTFHRVLPGQIIQTGDPTGSGSGGSGTQLVFEETNIKHVTGTVSMARSPEDKNSADSQFFICLKENSEFDGQYAAFGKISEGLDVAGKISQGDKIITTSVEFK